jgi:hypothetical protein
MARAEWRDDLDALCPYPDLGWVTFYKLTREWLRNTKHRSAVTDLRRAMAAMAVDPNGPTSPLHICRFFAALKDEPNAMAAFSIYHRALATIRTPMPRIHNTKTRTYSPEICVPPEN